MALGRTVSSVAPHAVLARAWDGSGVSGRVGAGGRVGPWPREAGGLAGPPDPREGAAFQSQLSVMTVPCRGLQWLSSAAHAVLDIHKAQALPAFPLLCHLGLNGGPHVQSGRPGPSLRGHWGGAGARPRPPAPWAQLLFSAGSRPRPTPGCIEDVRPKPLSSISVSQTPNVVQLGDHPT